MRPHPNLPASPRRRARGRLCLPASSSVSRHLPWLASPYPFVLESEHLWEPWEPLVDRVQLRLRSGRGLFLRSGDLPTAFPTVDIDRGYFVPALALLQGYQLGAVPVAKPVAVDSCDVFALRATHHGFPPVVALTSLGSALGASPPPTLLAASRALSIAAIHSLIEPEALS